MFTASLNNLDIEADFIGDDVIMDKCCQMSSKDNSVVMSNLDVLQHVPRGSRWKRLLRGPSAVSVDSKLVMGKHKVGVLNDGPQEPHGQDSGILKKSKLFANISNSELVIPSLTDAKEPDTVTVSFISTVAMRLADREP